MSLHGQCPKFAYLISDQDAWGGIFHYLTIPLPFQNPPKMDFKSQIFNVDILHPTKRYLKMFLHFEC